MRHSNKTSTRLAPPARRARTSPLLGGRRTGPAPPWPTSLHHLGAFNSLPLFLPLALGVSSGGCVGWGAGWPCGALGWWWLCLGVVLRDPPCPPAGPGGPRRALALALCSPTAPPWPPRASGATCGHLRGCEPALAGAFLSGAPSAPFSVCSGCVFLSPPL
jgi:hypothetical protein